LKASFAISVKLKIIQFCNSSNFFFFFSSSSVCSRSQPQNILLTAPYPDGDVKLCDFGISRLIDAGAELREIVGTPDYVGK
jgi:serine/threonine protein kinase